MIHIVRRYAPDLGRQAQALLLLLGDTPTQNAEAPGTAIPEASTNCGSDCLNRAAPTASTSLTRPEEVSREV